MASWGKEQGGAGSCNFPTDSCKFPTEEIMGAQNFNSAPKFRQNVWLSAQNFAFFEVNFPTRSTFSNWLKPAGKLPPLLLATDAPYRGTTTGGTATCVSSLTTSTVWKRLATDTPPHQNGESHKGPVNRARGRGTTEETSASHFSVKSARTSSTSSSSLMSANELARLRLTNGSSVNGRPVDNDSTWIIATDQI